MRYDLHVHTEHSDGSTPVEDIVACALRAGLDGIAITDHDSMGMVSRAGQAARGTGLTVLPGVELSTEDKHTGRKVHLLVYAPPRPEELAPIFERMAEARRRSGMEMIARVCERYPVTQEEIMRFVRRSSTIFRVHIVRALMEKGYDAQIYGPLYRELFAEPDGSCFVVTDYTDTDQAAQAARRSGGVVVLAHPGVYNSFETAERLGAGGLLDGIELDYPRRLPEELQQHLELVERHRFLCAGGTDFHGFYSPKPRPLGSCVTQGEQLKTILELIEKRNAL